MDGGRAWSTRDYGEKSEKPLSSLLVFLNDWLNFRVWDQFQIKMLIARGRTDINTTLSVIMSLFCCHSLCLCVSLSRCLCLFTLKKPHFWKKKTETEAERFTESVILYLKKNCFVTFKRFHWLRMAQMYVCSYEKLVAICS